jgi:alpha-L-rhamnosidase
LHLNLLRPSAWVWPGASFDLVNCYAQFRKVFHCEHTPADATAVLTADESYQFFVNGQYVCRGPARGYQSHWPVDQVDIAPFLRPGNNVFAVRVHTPGISTFRYRHDKCAGLLLGAQIGDLTLHTDSTWRCRFDPSRARAAGYLSKQMGFQEHVDLGKDSAAWHDASSAELPGWSAPVCRAFGSPPWHDVEPRGLPMLTREVKPYRSMVAEADFDLPVKPSAQPIEPVRELWRACRDSVWRPGTLETHGSGALGLTSPRVEADRAWAVILDLIDPSVGELIAEFQGAHGGETLDFLFTEALGGHGGPLIADPEETSKIAMATRLTLAPGDCKHQAFNIIGHRYATLIVHGPCPSLNMSIAHRQTRYPLEVAGAFSCDDDTLLQIHRMCINTQRNCMLDSYIDTPWREQAQWWGDARIQAWNTFHLANDTRPFRRGIRQIGDNHQALPNGLTYGHAPTGGHDCVLPDFSIVWLLTIWDDYFQTGDPRMFQEQWRRIQSVMGYFDEYLKEGRGLVQADDRYWLFLDWSPDIPRTGTPTLLNLLLLEAVTRMRDLAGACANPQAVEYFKPRVEALQQAIRTHLRSEDDRLYFDGLTPGGEPIRCFSIHTQVQAQRSGLMDSPPEPWVDRILRPFLAGEAVPGSQPSPYWLAYIYDVAGRVGLGAEAIEHLRRHWQPMLRDRGTWEIFFDNTENGESSRSHSWSSHPLHLFPRILCGISPAAPGWKQIRFDPLIHYPRCASASTVVPTPAGLIEARWTRQPKTTAVELSLPPGVSATCEIPGETGRDVTGEHRWELDQPGPSA